MILKKVLYLICAASIVSAQGYVQSTDNFESSNEFDKSPNSHEFRSAPLGVYKTTLPINNYVDENSYIVGNGDVFFISPVQIPSIKYTATVDSKGDLYIPDLGYLELGRIPLILAKQKISEYLKSKIRKETNFYISLSQVKTASVSIRGLISEPGAHNFQGTIRLFDAIKKANGDNIPALDQADLRAVKCTNNGEVKTFDLLAYLYRNDFTQNPYVFPGDDIYIKTSSQRVYITGAIRFPASGFYPIKEGETLESFLSLFSIDSSADLESIVVQRTLEGTTTNQNLSSSDFPLHNLDAIIIPLKKNFPDIQTISVSGEISSPGSYLIKKNITTAKMIIEQAGGITSDGNLSQAVILRTSKMFSERFYQGAPNLRGIRPELGVGVTMAASTADHIVVKLAERGLDILLEPGDQIIIPKTDKFVYISGNVKQPGAYEFSPGKDKFYYISQAGGLSKNANKSNIQVYLKFGETTQAVQTKEVEAGSIIIVPASQEYKFFSTVFLPLISALATTIGVGLAIYNSR